MKKEPPMKPNYSGVFEDAPSDAHKKVVRSLHAKGYSPESIAKATGLSAADVKKLINQLEVESARRKA